MIPPSMGTVCAVEKQRHPFFCTRREEHSFIMSAGWAPNFIGPWKSRIRPHILQNYCFLPRRMMYLVPKYTPVWWICIFFIPTSSTKVDELFSFLVFNGREQVIALGTKAQRWPVTRRHSTYFIYNILQRDGPCSGIYTGVPGRETKKCYMDTKNTKNRALVELALKSVSLASTVRYNNNSDS